MFNGHFLEKQMKADATKTAELLLQRLRLATRLIDEAATGISALPLAPVRGNVQSLGEAIAAVSEVMHVLYQAHPSLAPKWLESPNPHPEASRALGELLIEVEDLVEEGRREDALQLIRAFLESDPPDLHRELAEGHLERILEAMEDGDQEPGADTAPA